MMKIHQITALCGLSLFVCTVNATEPLKQEGKQTLFQRVLSTPGCMLTDSAGGKNGKAVPVFSRYYVDARQ